MRSNSLDSLVKLLTFSIPEIEFERFEFKVSIDWWVFSS